jgi:lysophospholipase L1-like esterase
MFQQSMRYGAVMALCILAATVSTAHAAPTAAPTWVRSAGVSLRAVDPATAEKIEDVTLRFSTRLTLGGPRVRVSLGNVFSKTALHIGAASLSYVDAGRVKVVPVTFSGQSDFSIPPGAPAVSDEIDAPLGQGQVVSISLYFPDKTALAVLHSDDHSPSAVSAAGNFVMAAEFPAAKSLAFQPFFTGIDVVARSGAKTIVAFGDSITDAGDDPAQAPWRWSDVLAQRLAAEGKPYAVANEAISGNRIVTDGGSVNALSRFDRDVLALPNVGYVIMFEGINDIGHSGYNPDTKMVEPNVTAEDIIAGFKQIIARAHQNGIKIYGAEMSPFEDAKYYTEDHQKIWLAVNAWIRTSGAFDALVDFKSAVSDPADPNRLNAKLERGDHLHPNADGERAMGNAISPSLFK